MKEYLKNLPISELKSQKQDLQAKLANPLQVKRDRQIYLDLDNQIGSILYNRRNGSIASQLSMPETIGVKIVEIVSERRVTKNTVESLVKSVTRSYKLKNPFLFVAVPAVYQLYSQWDHQEPGATQPQAISGLEYKKVLAEAFTSLYERYPVTYKVNPSFDDAISTFEKKEDAYYNFLYSRVGDYFVRHREVESYLGFIVTIMEDIGRYLRSGNDQFLYFDLPRNLKNKAHKEEFEAEYKKLLSEIYIGALRQLLESYILECGFYRAYVTTGNNVGLTDHLDKFLPSYYHKLVKGYFPL